MLRTLCLGLVGTLIASIGFSSTARASSSSTIDLLWNGTDTSASVSSATGDLILHILLTAGPNGSLGAGISVDYSEALSGLGVVSFDDNPNGGRIPPLLFRQGHNDPTRGRIGPIASIAM